MLHIPTPWHNCVVEVPLKGGFGETLTRFIVIKAKVVREALTDGTFDGDVFGPELQRGWKLHSTSTTNPSESNKNIYEENMTPTTKTGGSDVQSPSLKSAQSATTADITFEGCNVCYGKPSEKIELFSDQKEASNTLNMKDSLWKTIIGKAGSGKSNFLILARKVKGLRNKRRRSE